MFRIKDYLNDDELKVFCQKHNIKRLSIFGSALRDELTPESDLDLLVEFHQNQIPGLLDFAGMEIELSEKLQIKVDLRTPAELSQYFRDAVIEVAKVVYAA